MWSFLPLYLMTLKSPILGVSPVQLRGYNIIAMLRIIIDLIDYVVYMIYGIIMNTVGLCWYMYLYAAFKKHNNYALQDIYYATAPLLIYQAFERGLESPLACKHIPYLFE